MVSELKEDIQNLLNGIKISISTSKTTSELDDIRINSLGKKGSITLYLRNIRDYDIEIKKEIVGEKGKLLTENLQISVSFYNQQPISIELPNQVKCKIELTDVALKGQTVSSSYKPATLDNGLSIQVPPFIETGDEIIVDTRNLEYIKKI